MTSKKNIDKATLATINDDPNKYAHNVTTKKLATVIGILNAHYYATENPLVDDDTYDTLIDVLKQRDPHNKVLFEVGANLDGKESVQLPFSMPSLNKIKPGEKSLRLWYEKYKGPYVVADKLDGISAQIYKNIDGTISLYTRGKCVVGRNVSHLIKYVVPDKSLVKLPLGVSIRGELLISKDDFQSISDKYKNPRNTVAGIVNSDNPDVRILSKIQMVLYEIIHPEYKYSKQLKLLDSWGFKVVWHDVVEPYNDNLIEKELELINLLEKRRRASEFDIDGIVVTDNSMAYQHTDMNPQHAMAFKTNVAQNMKIATVAEVIWEPTMYGYLQPVIRIEPIELLGTTITYVTGHNAKYIYDNKIGAGSKIKVVRSGDVIPYVVEVTSKNEKPDMPKIDYEWNATNIDAVVVNPSGDIKRLIDIKKNVHFFKTIGTKHLNQGVMGKLYDGGYMTIIEIIEAATNNYDIEVKGLGSTLMDKIYKEINKSLKSAKLPELMAGSLIFGRGIGTKKIREITKIHPEILTYTYDTKEMLDCIKNVPNFSDVSAKKFVSGLGKFKKFLKKIEAAVGHEFIFAIKKGTKFDGQNIVLTGFRNSDITNYIETNGGKVTGSVSKKTTLVIYASDDTASAKYQKAKELNIPLMTLDEFKHKYNI